MLPLTIYTGSSQKNTVESEIILNMTKFKRHSHSKLTLT